MCSFPIPGRRDHELPGAKHLYLIDFDPRNLPDLKRTIQDTYPDVKVHSWTRSSLQCLALMFYQVTTLQADAADEAAISGVCSRALHEEGRLDVFFANVRARIHHAND